MKSKNSRIEAAIRAPSFRGALVRVGGVMAIYLLVTILPKIFAFMAIHANWNTLSKVQLDRHHSIVVIFRAIVFLVMVVELVQGGLRYLRRRSSQQKSG
ncbi:hypothetical protein [Ralstonia syzygii]|nr:hypothetical protein [Ralstonia syzygii]